ncbi:hypothetical protein I302_104866 [Kwoniella bestiolae CBS 10118]|uniref:Hemerythrin-like domain-containing protein n=1 Tax=Kwoniella bestiolae CBS 10118 TaxID=1296100 RepID=A0A1B9FRI8_9TREE|nr:hypothetical protein I302_09064 [Kwoniella bestiolae CBS 10118]OCF21387.1 hypothetical protein I302_09064 [Kwoniella bestiolae CBS 10118]
MAVIKSHPLPAHPEGSPFLSQEFQKIMEGMKRKAEVEKPVKWQEHWQWEMSNVHLFLIQMIERAYLYAPYAVEQNDLPNFLGYAEISFFQVYSHHSAEEEFVFPTFVKHSKNEIWSQNVAEHHTFDQALDATWLYIRACQEKLPVNGKKRVKSPVPPPSKDLVNSIDLKSFVHLDFERPFDVEEFRRHIEGFIVPLVQHLGSEIETLTPELMDSVGAEGDREVRKWLDGHLKEYDPAWFLCSAFASVPISLCKQMIQLPFLVRRVLVPFMLAPKHKGYWLYAPHPENLTFKGTA